MKRATLAVWLVLLGLVVGAGLAGSLGGGDPTQSPRPGLVVGSVVSEVPEDATVVALDSTAVPADSHVAAAVRAAVATHERTGGGSTTSVGPNASEMADARTLLDSLDTSLIQYRGYVVEVSLAVEE